MAESAEVVGVVEVEGGHVEGEGEHVEVEGEHVEEGHAEGRESIDVETGSVGEKESVEEKENVVKK